MANKVDNTELFLSRRYDLRSALGFFSIFAILVAGLLLLVRLVAPTQLQSDFEQANLIYLLMLLVLIGGGALGSSRADISLALRQALIWLAIFLLVVVAYSFREEVSALGHRVRAEILPSSPVNVDDQEQSTQGSVVALRKSDDGHFHADAKVNRAHVRFLVDTGASSVALTLADAKRVGIDVDQLNYSVPISTASGQAFAAYVVVDKISIGQISLRNVDAFVIREGLDTSLLGMSFLGRLQKFEASRNQLILRK